MGKKRKREINNEEEEAKRAKCLVETWRIQHMSHINVVSLPTSVLRPFQRVRASEEPAWLSKKYGHLLAVPGTWLKARLTHQYANLSLRETK